MIKPGFESEASGSRIHPFSHYTRLPYFSLMYNVPLYLLDVLDGQLPTCLGKTAFNDNLPVIQLTFEDIHYYVCRKLSSKR